MKRLPYSVRERQDRPWLQSWLHPVLTPQVMP
jgi:hypothetical protein